MQCYVYCTTGIFKQYYSYKYIVKIKLTTLDQLYKIKFIKFMKCHNGCLLILSHFASEP